MGRRGKSRRSWIEEENRLKVLGERRKDGWLTSSDGQGQSSMRDPALLLSSFNDLLIRAVNLLSSFDKAPMRENKLKALRTSE